MFVTMVTVGASAQGATGTDLYRQLVAPGLNPAQVFQLRHVSIDREDLHIGLSDGTIALLEAIDGRITGAVFEGQGELLLVPPNRAERSELGLFTKSGVLNEHFTTAYLRFVDDQLVENLRSGLRPSDEGKDFVAKWRDAVKSLAITDGLQLLEAMTNSGDAATTFLHLRVGGSSLGIFDVFFNSQSPEQIIVAQTNKNGGKDYYDVWTSFAVRSMRESGKSMLSRSSAVHISEFRIRSAITPPSSMEAEAELTLTPERSGERTLLFQLSRYLRVSQVRLGSEPVEFIQDEATNGSTLAREGNDLMALVMPHPLEKDRAVKLNLKYSGPVMYDAGGDLLYVGARGTWYPNLGPSFAAFDLTFDYPSGWTLVATGRQVSSVTRNGRQVTRFVSEKPIAHAGFNLGKFASDTTHAGSVVIDSYAASNVELPLARTLARNEAAIGVHPQPALMVQMTAHEAAATVEFLSRELEPFPYSRLEIAQLPALLSQSWPGLIYLSSLAFLTPHDRAAMGLRDPYLELLFSKLMLAHETAHQWWGDAVNCDSYRDEWIIEALANYNALMMLEQQNPQGTKLALDHYRQELLKETPSGIVADSGPVTVGERLVSSKVPDSLEPVLYGRGTWLFHMLRALLREASGDKNDALFFKALRSLLAKSPNHKISTHDVQQAFEEVMPASLTYEGQKNLDWFFDSWVNGTSVPEFAVEGVKVPGREKTTVSGTIREKYAAKDMVTAVPLYSVDEAGHQQFLGLVFVDEDKTDFQFTAPAGTKQVVLDPEETVLRR